ncbi:MAG: hypothetical protein K8I29_05840 [Alphaproteobacteria bacterium]|uniref:Uncharacterized protein n=1 Tax=Candidatus Nitrobium versatile TaxID=2884831 RepID=A0A953J504_9BACT|nr:hypothetical protein [Candidatus Nitrobium versatile]
MKKLFSFSFYMVLLCSPAGCLFDRSAPSQEAALTGGRGDTERLAAMAGNGEEVTASFIVERPDEISDEELMEIRASHTSAEMTLDEAKRLIELHADRQKMPESMRESIFETLKGLARHIPVKEAYKLVSLRFNLSDLNEFKRSGSADYEKSIGLNGRAVFRR